MAASIFALIRPSVHKNKRQEGVHLCTGSWVVGSRVRILNTGIPYWRGFVSELKIDLLVFYRKITLFSKVRQVLAGA